MSATQTTHDELPIQEFIRRQRLRAESICCTPRRAFSPYPPPPTIPESRPPPSSPSPWIQHHALFLITLILLTSFHLFLSARLQPFRFRTHAATSTRLHFPTTILPSALLHPTPKTPRPPFSNLTHLPTLYPLSATASLHHLLALHAPCTTLIHSLAHTRHASHTATRALTHLHAVALHTNTTRHLAPPIAAVRTALSSLTRTSERWALHASLLAAEEGLEAVLQTGVGAQLALVIPTEARTWWRGSSSSTAGGKKGVERAARLRTACAAAAFRRALDEVEGRLPGIVGMGEEAKRAVGAVDRAVLGVCRGAVDVVGDIDDPVMRGCAGAVVEDVGAARQWVRSKSGVDSGDSDEDGRGG
ncbi:hypothetical protein GTA08_BOTSDO01764 [Botryosphaeria dothidea]|uniref:Uncharacterized protein n=1 Tax=Botryosphaeria dothidea TaxID=55169 RepID=A0A8H4NBJ8_9PEZI|nr:hypothetical protein GTA08_BOTSDO01764 [Botryosphaeria dothidea]